MTTLDQVIDHAADLQQSLDRLWSELLLCYLTIFALAVMVTFLTFHAWRGEP